MSPIYFVAVLLVSLGAIFLFILASMAVPLIAKHGSRPWVQDLVPVVIFVAIGSALSVLLDFDADGAVVLAILFGWRQLDRLERE